MSQASHAIGIATRSKDGIGKHTMLIRLGLFLFPLFRSLRDGQEQGVTGGTGQTLGPLLTLTKDFSKLSVTCPE